MTRLSEYLRDRLSTVAAQLWKQHKGRHLRGRSMQDVFTSIYAHNAWRESETRSGVASTLAGTETLRAELPRLLEGLGARSLLDIPCGDFHWMKETRLELDRYIGADIVDELVASSKPYESATRRFVKLDITRDSLPKVDVVLCRDCLIHFSFADIARALANIKASESSYLLTTTFTRESRRNFDIVTGEWRPLNLERPPFGLRPPIAVIREGFGSGGKRYADRSLGLWRVENL